MADDRAARRGPGPIRVVFFDVGGTLVRPVADLGDVLREEAWLLGVALPPAVLSRVPDLVTAGLEERAREGRPFTYPAGASEAFWMGIYAEALSPACPPGLIDAIARRVYGRLSSPVAYSPYPDALPTLRELAALGYVLGIVSNWEAWLRGALAAMGLGGLFAHVIISGEVKLEKPDPRIFRMALDATGCLPEEMAYVGDSPTVDAAAAEDAGLVGILVARNTAASNENSHERPARVVDSLVELVPLLTGRPGGQRRQGEPAAIGCSVMARPPDSAAEARGSAPRATPLPALGRSAARS